MDEPADPKTAAQPALQALTVADLMRVPITIGMVVYSLRYCGFLALCFFAAAQCGK